jgi:hypothetical protein
MKFRALTPQEIAATFPHRRIVRAFARVDDRFGLDGDNVFLLFEDGMECRLEIAGDAVSCVAILEAALDHFRA